MTSAAAAAALLAGDRARRCARNRIDLNRLASRALLCLQLALTVLFLQEGFTRVNLELLLDRLIARVFEAQGVDTDFIRIDRLLLIGTLAVEDKEISEVEEIVYILELHHLSARLLQHDTHRIDLQIISKALSAARLHVELDTLTGLRICGLNALL